MTLQIRGEGLTITPELEAFTEDKLNKLNRYLPNIESLYVELTVQSHKRGPDTVVAEITLRHSRGAILRTEEKLEKIDRDTVKAAITSASDKMYRRIRRFKGKQRGKRVRERYMASAEELQLAEAMPDEINEAETASMENGTATETIIRRKDVMMTAMNEEEAIEQMELLGHTFFVYFDADTNSVNVVYKRRTEGYGLIIPHIE